MNQKHVYKEMKRSDTKKQKPMWRRADMPQDIDLTS